MSGIHPTAAVGFSRAAEVYERARPSYPAEAVDWMVEVTGLGPGYTVVDVGAGTGKLTRLLAPTGARVVAVEPVAEMRALIERAEVLEGTAEALPFPDGAADVVTVAQAFHWFELDRALPEIHRVLRPGGHLALFWNSRDLDDPLQAALERLLQPLRRSVVAQQEHDWRGAVAAARCSDPPGRSRSCTRRGSGSRIFAHGWPRRHSSRRSSRVSATRCSTGSRTWRWGSSSRSRFRTAPRCT